MQFILPSPCTLELRGFDECKASIESIGEGMSNAGFELRGETDNLGSIVLDGTTVTWFDHYTEGMVEGEGWPLVVIHVRPTGGLVLFTSALMLKMPGRAVLKWRNGWPYLYCPPNDPRRVSSRPVLPNVLEPA